MREAIQVLGAVGLITVRHGKRALVRESGDWNVLHPLVQDAFRQEGRGRELTEQLYDVRWALECFVAELGANKISSKDLERLLELRDGMDLAHRSQIDVRSFLDLDKEFHFILARASGNLPAFAILKGLSSSALGDWWKRVSAGDLPLLAEQHSRIADALAKRDGRAAAEMMSEHLKAGRAVHIIQTDTP
ncbi:hypothetical protein MesoLj113b_57100 [Mesorhizobium sp. 113-3-3]|nr:hypothetical protein MesoLj113b_57100 [Mesorhizobium sp. 113-3-3]